MRKRGNVLVVEKDPSVRESLVTLLGQSYEVMGTESGTQAIAALRKVPIHTIVLEPWLPGIQGRELLDLLRRESPQARIIIVSGQRLSLWFDDMVRDEIFDYLPKPFEPRDLLRTVDRSIVRQRLRVVDEQPVRPGVGALALAGERGAGRTR